ncbi:hypothetical protein AB1K84_04865 [Mesobacillus foraminis]|uniref:hypothetical protein n=1 Tax=Mesobacillus foraminis TaxID=279826 RepID=UPI0039A3E86B
MKKLTKTLYFNVALLMLSGCTYNTNEESITAPSENRSVSESTGDDATKTSESTSISEVEETDNDDAGGTSSEESVTSGLEDGPPDEHSDSDTGDPEEVETRSQYSNEQIEYARVWLQLGANQIIDGLYVEHIPAGTPLNPNDDTSVSYPEAVIQLAGSRLVDGSVTYSSNGDGTINVYNVPLRWDGQYPAGKKFYTDIIKNTQLESIEQGDDEKIIELIKLLKVNVQQ